MSKQKNRQGQQRRQARAERKKRQRKDRRQARAKERYKIMSRQKDIANLSTEIEDKQKELQALGQKIQTYSQEVSDSITAILKKAGVFDKINDLENGRREVQQEGQQKANQLQAEIADLTKMRSWLMGQEQADDVEPGAKDDEDKPDLQVVEDEADEDEADEAPADEDKPKDKKGEKGEKPEKPSI